MVLVIYPWYSFNKTERVIRARRGFSLRVTGTAIAATSNVLGFTVSQRPLVVSGGRQRSLVVTSGRWWSLVVAGGHQWSLPLPTG